MTYSLLGRSEETSILFLLHLITAFDTMDQGSATHGSGDACSPSALLQWLPVQCCTGIPEEYQTREVGCGGGGVTPDPRPLLTKLSEEE